MSSVQLSKVSSKMQQIDNFCLNNFCYLRSLDGMWHFNLTFNDLHEAEPMTVEIVFLHHICHHMLRLLDVFRILTFSKQQIKKKCFWIHLDPFGSKYLDPEGSLKGSKWIQFEVQQFLIKLGRRNHLQETCSITTQDYNNF